MEKEIGAIGDALAQLYRKLLQSDACAQELDALFPKVALTALRFHLSTSGDTTATALLRKTCDLLEEVERAASESKESPLPNVGAPQQPAQPANPAAADVQRIDSETEVLNQIPHPTVVLSDDEIKILQILASSRRPRSAEEIHDELMSQDVTIQRSSLSTKLGRLVLDKRLIARPARGRFVINPSGREVVRAMTDARVPP